MGITDIFKKRKFQSDRAGSPIIYRQDLLPEGFRIQVMWIWRQSIGEPQYGGHIIDKFWKALHDDIAEEEKLYHLGDPSDSYCVRCQQYLGTAPVESALSIIERSFQLIERVHVSLARDGLPLHLYNLTMSYEGAVDTLNKRFAENKIGYQYVDDRIVSAESQYVHSEITVPALQLLH